MPINHNVKYSVFLFYDYKLVGDVRPLARNLRYSATSSRYGTDSISFDIDLNAFADWLKDRRVIINSTMQEITLKQLLRPILLTAVVCRYRNNDVNSESRQVGGVLIQMPRIDFQGGSGTLHMQFDGFMNLLDGVVFGPQATTIQSANAFISGWLTLANNRSDLYANAGDALKGSNGYQFYYDSANSEQLAVITRTYDNYKTVKEAIFEMCDNTEGAGEFDVIVRHVSSYKPEVVIKTDATLESGGVLNFPSGTSGDGVQSISIRQDDSFMSNIIVLGNGETSSNSDYNTVLAASANQSVVGNIPVPAYRQKIYQYSSMTRQSTIQGRANALVAKYSKLRWRPTLTLTGSHYEPSPFNSIGGEDYSNIWIRKKFKINVSPDPLNIFETEAVVRTISVAVAETDAETINAEMEFLYN